jgi:hypothetical protein
MRLHWGQSGLRTIFFSGFHRKNIEKNISKTNPKTFYVTNGHFRIQFNRGLPLKLEIKNEQTVLNPKVKFIVYTYF